MIPLDLLLTYLAQVDEVTLLELLDISTEDLIAKFADKIEARRDYLEKEFELVGEACVVDTSLRTPEELGPISSFENADYDYDEWN